MRLPFLNWLLGCGAPDERPLSPAERQALDALDAVLRAPGLPDALLPRAASLIPQLLAMLRQAELPVSALARRVAQEPVLAAEVLRLASSPFYRAQGAVGDLSQALQLIGQRGLQQCIARVVLKPIFAGPSAGGTAFASVRLWAHAELQAGAAARAAAGHGVDPFDGYLAGLLHGSGWMVAWRAMARAGVELPLPPSAEFSEAIERRAHALFGRATRGWSITPGLTAFAAEAERIPLDASTHPLGAVLREAALAASGALAGPAAIEAADDGALRRA